MHRNAHLYNMISSFLIALFNYIFIQLSIKWNAFMVLLWHTKDKSNSANLLLKHKII